MKRKMTACISSTVAMLLLLSMSAFSAHATPLYLSVPIYRQEQGLWCWAATAKSVAVFLGGSKASQCQYVKWGKATSTCANVTGSFTTDVTRALKSAGITKTGTVMSKAVDSAIVAQQITNRKPVLIRWGWSNGSGHNLVIRGYTSDPGYMVVSYIDPGNNAYRSGTYSWMKKASGHTWTHTRYDMSK